MRVAAAVTAGMAAVVLVTATARTSPLQHLGVYLARRRPQPAATPTATSLRLRRAGLTWDETGYRLRLLVAGLGGAFAGLLAAAGDLFLPGRSRSAAGLAVLGAAAAAFALRSRVSTRGQRRAARLRRELPTVADTLALHVLAGESIPAAMEHYVEIAGGVAAWELRLVIADYRAGASVPEALVRAAPYAGHPDAARLYSVLANAHETGGRLADDLAALAADFRAGLARDLTAEGGRRALTTYGPILALMVPVTVIFLMYPTLVGLRDLSGGP